MVVFEVVVCKVVVEEVQEAQQEVEEPEAVVVVQEVDPMSFSSLTDILACSLQKAKNTCW